MTAAEIFVLAIAMNVVFWLFATPATILCLWLVQRFFPSPDTTDRLRLLVRSQRLRRIHGEETEAACQNDAMRIAMKEDDRGWHSLLGGRSSPGPLSSQNPMYQNLIYNKFQGFLYDSACNATKGRVDDLRTRLENVGARFSDHPWIVAGPKPNEWVFDVPFGGFLLVDSETAEKILVLGLP